MRTLTSNNGGSHKGTADVPRPPSKTDLRTYRGRLGAAVRKQREALGLTQAELCDRLAELGCHVQVVSLSAYEVGTRPIQIDHLPAFAKALRVPIRQLVPAK